MASADYSVGTKVTADVSNFEKGMNKAEKSLKGFSDKLANSIDRLGKKGLVGSLGSVGLALGGITSAVGIATKAIKKVSQAIGECTEAFREQNKAEIALETAVKNNPYIDGSSLNSLKQFAGEMQRVSEIGDEQFLPMMAQLIATGRTEAETMDIIRVATDMSATGTMSFETAVQQLSATLNGNIGRLGQQNSELKNLTEEELKSGKAVEILGNKFKGLAEATADTSKQLKNALGDLKENLGRIFETALAPMRKFFTEVISNLNDILKKSADVKKAMKDVFSEENINIEAPTDSLQIALDEVLKKQREVTANYSQYIQLYGKYIDQTTDETVKAYKEQISDLNKQIKKLSEELIKRRKESDAQAKARKEAEANAEEEKQINDLKEKYLKLIAEQEAKWTNIKKVTGEAVKNEERLKFYQEQLVAIMTESGGKITENNQYYKDQMAIIQGILEEIGNPEKQTEWANKLLDQRIEMLETERDSAMQYAEEEGEETYTIWRDYNEKILALKLERLENEKEKALEEEGLTADDKIKIEEYYSGETQGIYNELGKYKKKKNEEEKKETKKTFSEMVGYAKNYAENVKQVFSKIADTIKNVMSNIKNVFSKILDVFKFDPDEALIALLKVEDSILTFFVETLPRLPKFFESALQSVLILLKNLVTNINWEKIQEIINNLVDLIIEYTPDIVTNLLDVIIHVAQALLDGLIRFINNGGWKMILDMLLTIQKRIEDFVTDNIDEIVDTIVAMLPDLVQFLIDSIVSASKTFKKLIKPLIKLIMALIEAVFEVLLSDEVLEAGLDALMGLIEAINEELLPRIAYLIPKLIVKIIGFVVKNLPKLVVGIVEGLIKAFITVNWFDVVKEIFMGFIDGFKELFGIHSPSTLFEGFGQNIIEGLVEGLKGLAEALNTMLMPLYDFVVNVIGKIIDAFNAIGVQVNTLTNSTFKGFVDMIKASGEPMRVMGKVTIAVMGAIGRTLADIHNLIRDIIHELTTIKVWTPWETYEIGGVDIGTVTPPDMTPYINLVNALKDGTDNARKGLTLVGEAGPELVEFNGGERVLNNRNTNKALENMGGNTNNFNVTFNNMQDTSAFAMLQQLKQYNRQMAINGVI